MREREWRGLKKDDKRVKKQEKGAIQSKAKEGDKNRKKALEIGKGDDLGDPR